MRAGIIASAVLAPHIRKDAKAPQPSDFMPDEKYQRSGPKRQSKEEMKAMMLDMVAASKRAEKKKKK